jgi:hypothetical protein
MIFKQLFDKETWTYTYLIADPVSKEALFIDPRYRAKGSISPHDRQEGAVRRSKPRLR